MAGLADFVGSLAAIKEGDGTLLDNILVYAHSDTCFAKVHSNESIPVMTFGKAGGRVKTGLHIAGNGDPITRTGLTAMQLMGVPVDSWGSRSMQVNKPVSEIMA
jgi:hypothetical protein